MSLLIFLLIVFVVGIAYGHFKLHLSVADMKTDLENFWRSQTIANAKAAKPPQPIPAFVSGLSPADPAPSLLPLSPLPPTPPQPGHGATPPSNAGATGSLVGQAVPGGDKPDANNGSVAYDKLAPHFAPGSRFLMIPTLPYVPEKSAAAFCIAANCGDSATDAQITGLAEVCAFPAIPNPPAAAAVGGPAFHLLGQAPGEKGGQVIHGVIVLPSTLTTFEAVDAYAAHLAAYNPNVDYGHGFSPNPAH